MNAVVKKLNKLYETKQAIKQAIIDKGISVSDSEPFSLYAKKILSIPQETSIYGEVVISNSELSVNEGDNTTFTVRLDKAINSTQTVTLSKDTNYLSLDKVELMFNKDNWNIPQVVSIHALSNENTTNDIYTIIITSLKSITQSKAVSVRVIEFIHVQSISFNKNSLSLFKGNTEQLSVIYKPTNATNQNVTWKSSDDTRATVVNGLISAKEVGIITVTGTSEDGDKVATCNVNIQEQLEGLDIFKYTTIPFPTNTNISIPANGLTVDDGTNDYVHPSVLYFKNELFGKKYWMGVNPYNNTQGQYENAFLYCSDDGITWSTPTGVMNPLINKKGDVNNNSDIHLFHDEGTLYIINRGARNNSTSEIEFISTKDGITYTIRKTILDNRRDYVSPSICKFKNKYYMFVVDITDSVRTKLTVFESATIDGEWIQINQINTGTTPMWHPEVSFQSVTNEFLLIFSKGDAQGGALFLGKFNSPNDTDVILCPYALVDSYGTPRGIKGFSTCYKSSAYIDEIGNLVVYLGTKGSALDSGTGWRVSRCSTNIIQKSLVNDRILRESYNDFSELTTNIYNCKSDNIKRVDYMVEYNIKDLNSFRHIVAFFNTSYFLVIDKIANSDSISIYEFAYGNVQNNKQINQVILKDSLVSILKIGTNIRVYVDGRLGCDYNISVDINNYLLSPISGYNHISNIKYYNYDEEFIADYTTQNKEMEDKITNSLGDNEIILADNFNRTGVVEMSTNGVIWNNKDSLAISGNKVSLQKSKRLILDNLITDNINIYVTSVNSLGIYIQYTDSNEYTIISLDASGMLSLITCINGIQNVNNNKAWNVVNCVLTIEILSDKIIVYSNKIPIVIWNVTIINKNISLTSYNLTTSLLDNILIEKYNNTPQLTDNTN